MWPSTRQFQSFLLRRIVTGGRNLSAASAAIEVKDEEYEYPKPDPKFSEVLRAIPRTTETILEPKKIRRGGRVPSIIFSAEHGETGGNKRLISLEASQIRSLLDRCGVSFFKSRTFEVEVRTGPGSDTILERSRVLPKLVHVYNVTDEILNVTLIRAPPGAILKVDIPVLYIGEDTCIGIRKGGFLNIRKRTLRFKCPADIIPPYIEVDVSELNIGMKLVVSDLKFHPELKYVGELNDFVCNVKGSKYRV